MSRSEPPPEIPAAIAAGGQDRGRRDILRDLIIGKKAEVKGIVKTRSAVVLGSVEGDSAVQTKATANVIGNISAGTLSIEESAIFSDRSNVKQTSQQAEKTHGCRNAA